MNDVTISGLDLTSRCLREQGEDIGYLALSEITDRNRSVGAARVDFSAVGLGPWLKREAGDDEDEDPDDDEPTDGDDELPDLRDALGEGIVSAPVLAVAAMRWIVETVTALMAGRIHGKFKIGLWTPGGKTMLHSARFEAKNPNARRREIDEESEVEAEGRPVAPARGPDLAPTVQPPATRPGAVPPDERVWHALGDGYTQLISLTQSTYSHIAKLQSAEIQSLSSQNKRLHDTLENVSNDLRHVHIGTAEAQRDEANEASSSKVREELGKQFIEQLGSVGRAFVASKVGIPPELAGLVDAISQSPELMETLKIPAVQAMMRDEKVRTELAELLKLAASAKGTQDASPAADGKGTDPRQPNPSQPSGTDGVTDAA